MEQRMLPFSSRDNSNRRNDHLPIATQTEYRRPSSTSWIPMCSRHLIIDIRSDVHRGRNHKASGTPREDTLTDFISLSFLSGDHNSGLPFEVAASPHQQPILHPRRTRGNPPHKDTKKGHLQSDKRRRAEVSENGVFQFPSYGFP